MGMFFPSDDPKMPTRDRLFLRFMSGIFILLVLYGFGTMVVLFFVDQTIGLRMVSAFGSMFAGVLGLGSGYLLGKSNNGDEKKPPN